MNDGRVSYRMTARFEVVMQEFFKQVEEIKDTHSLPPPLPWSEVLEDFIYVAENEKRKMKFLTRIGAPKQLLERLKKVELALLQPHFNSLEEVQG
jgi:hypothetical protein